MNRSLNDLQNIQDKIVKALFCKFFPTKSLNEVYNLVNIPTINQVYKILVSTYLYEILKTNKYPQLRSSTESLIFNHNYNTRNNTLLIPLSNFSKYKYHFLYNSIKVWNEIPADLKNKSYMAFKTGIRKHFMSLSFWYVPHLYIWKRFWNYIHVCVYTWSAIICMKCFVCTYRTHIYVCVYAYICMHLCMFVCMYVYIYILYMLCSYFSSSLNIY